MIPIYSEVNLLNVRISVTLHNTFRYLYAFFKTCVWLTKLYSSIKIFCKYQKICTVTVMVIAIATIQSGVLTYINKCYFSIEFHLTPFHLFRSNDLYLMYLFCLHLKAFIFSSTGQRPANYCHGIVSVLRLSVLPSM